MINVSRSFSSEKCYVNADGVHQKASVLHWGHCKMHAKHWPFPSCFGSTLDSTS